MLISELVERAAALFKTPDPKARYGSRRLTMADIVDRGNKKSFSPARYALYKALHMRGMSYSRVRKVVGRDCHSTIIYGIAKAEAVMESDPDYAYKVRYIALMRDSESPATTDDVVDYVFSLLDVPREDSNAVSPDARRARYVAVRALKELGCGPSATYGALRISINGYTEALQKFDDVYGEDELAQNVLDATIASFEGDIYE